MKISEALAAHRRTLVKELKQKISKIIFLDIETAPSIGYVWGKWDQNVLDFIQDGYLLSFSYKVAGQTHVTTRGLPDYPETWAKDMTDDSALLDDLWQVLDKADIIVAHNGDAFDLPTIRGRMLERGFNPPSPYQTVDTLQHARKQFKFKSNKLDDLCRDLGIGRKLPHTGFNLWQQCMKGDKASWHLMKRYNRRDVLLLEELYYRFLPWLKTHPNINRDIFDGDFERCIRCGSKNIKLDGFRFTNLRKKDQIHCLSCGGWFEGRIHK